MALRILRAQDRDDSLPIETIVLGAGSLLHQIGVAVDHGPAAMWAEVCRVVVAVVGLDDRQGGANTMAVQILTPPLRSAVLLQFHLSLLLLGLLLHLLDALDLGPLDQKIRQHL